MTQESKELLIRDLSARVPYGVKLKIPSVWNGDEERDEDINDVLYSITPDGYINTDIIDSDIPVENIKPYLRPMSSITDKERGEFFEISGLTYYDGLFSCKRLAKRCSFVGDTLNYLCSHHLDFNGLIDIGLAIEAPEGMYKIKN